MSSGRKKNVERETAQNGAENAPPLDRDNSEQDHGGEEGSLSEQLKAAQEKADDNYDRFLRVNAEFENFKKRAEREMNEFRKFANESLMKEILPVIDNLERALAAECDGTKEAVKGLRDGVDMTLKGLVDTLEKFGVVAIESLGKPFDPNFHQAVSQEETDEYPAEAVSKELQKGYLLNNRLLRPAMVIVSKGSPGQEALSDTKSGDSGKKVKVTVH